ncbi:MAG: hypothetical protein JXA25_15700 [Anaerolineales bacterium]|nr:hypothetical protein [Anaerolineales bacterium]
MFLLYNLPHTAGRLIFLSDGILLPVRGLSVTIALLTGTAALILMQKQKTAGKSRLFAWIGIALGAGWILLGMLVGAAFFLGEILHGS